MKKHLFEIKHYDHVYDCYLMRATYQYNKSLALVFYDNSDDCPFANVTVCIPDTNPDDYCAFVDVNNWPEIEEFILKNKIGEPTGVKVKSGYVTYPEYRFNPALIDDLPFLW